MLVTLTETSVSILLGIGDGTFAAQMQFASGNGINGVSIADFNGDGIMDLVTANSQFFSVSLLLGIGDGSFDAPEFIPGGGFAQAVSTGDFNGDGSVDFATVNGFCFYR